MDKVTPEDEKYSKKEIEIDREAAMLNVNQMINNKMDNL